jgi:hypothetical protein
MGVSLKANKCCRCGGNSCTNHNVYIDVNETTLIKIESCKLIICGSCGNRLFDDELIKSKEKKISKKLTMKLMYS